MHDYIFRAWDKVDKKYIYDAIEFYTKCLDLPPAYQPDDSMPIGFTSISEGQRFDIEIWTGLLDKTGKKIFVGDIVRTLICFGPAGEQYCDIPIKYNKLGEISIQLWVFNESQVHWPEIIGNINE